MLRRILLLPILIGFGTAQLPTGTSSGDAVPQFFQTVPELYPGDICTLGRAVTQLTTRYRTHDNRCPTVPRTEQSCTLQP